MRYFLATSPIFWFDYQNSARLIAIFKEHKKNVIRLISTNTKVIISNRIIIQKGVFQNLRKTKLLEYSIKEMNLKDFPVHFALCPCRRSYFQE